MKRAENEFHALICSGLLASTTLVTVRRILKRLRIIRKEGFRTHRNTVPQVLVVGWIFKCLRIRGERNFWPRRTEMLEYFDYSLEEVLEPSPFPTVVRVSAFHTIGIGRVHHRHHGSGRKFYAVKPRLKYDGTLNRISSLIFIVRRIPHRGKLGRRLALQKTCKKRFNFHLALLTVDALGDRRSFYRGDEATPFPYRAVLDCVANPGQFIQAAGGKPCYEVRKAHKLHE